MAATAGMASVTCGLRKLTDGNVGGVLLAAAGKFGGGMADQPEGRGWGIALGQDVGASVATIAEVEVNQRTGAVQVTRVVCAQDMGIVVNPEGAAMQMEGCVTMGLGYALRENLRFRGGEILDKNFDTYEIPRFSWLPEIETVLVKNDDIDPKGGGEPAIINMGAVVANAIFDATGARVYRLPMTPERVLEAIRSS